MCQKNSDYSSKRHQMQNMHLQLFEIIYVVLQNVDIILNVVSDLGFFLLIKVVVNIHCSLIQNVGFFPNLFFIGSFLSSYCIQ